LEAVQALAAVDDVARGCGQITGDGVEGRSLARAVRTDEREHLSFLDVEGHALNGGHAAEADRQAIDRERRARIFAHCAACLALVSGASAGLACARMRAFHQPASD